MADLFETLKELIGDEVKAKEVQSKLGEYMIPKTEYAKLRDKNKEYETQIESQRIASMNEQEKLQHELSKAQAIQKDFLVKSNRLDAERIFVEAGLSKEAYDSILDSTVTDDRERTISTVNTFVNILSKEKELVASKTKEALINQTPKPDSGNTPPETNKPITVKTSI